VGQHVAGRQREASGGGDEGGEPVALQDEHDDGDLEEDRRAATTKRSVLTDSPPRRAWSLLWSRTATVKNSTAQRSSRSSAPSVVARVAMGTWVAVT